MSVAILDKPVMAVTGGAAGIGLAVAAQWISDGGRAILLDFNPDALEVAVRDCGADARAIMVDVSRQDSVDAAYRNIADQEGRLNAVVNCAGIARHARVAELRDEEWSRTLDVHLGGTMRSCRAAYALLKAAAQRREVAAIVNVSSIAGTNGTPGRASYSTAKAGMNGLTRTLAVEWGPDGIRVNSIAPGLTRTALVGALIEQGEINVDNAARRTALGRIAETREIAAPVNFLCSGGASFITGTCLMVDGGITVDGNWY